MKHLFCINPAAGKYDHSKEYLAAIRETCADMDYGYFISTEPGQFTQIVRDAAETGEEYHVYACGGDGTLNEVVCGAAQHPNVAVTHWPGGSGNDFIRAFDQPERFRSLPDLLDYETADFDLIEANGKWCIGVASIGVDARIGTEIARYKRLPLVTGSGAYVISTVVNVVKGIHQHYRILIDDQEFDGEQTMVCLCNGRWYGGGFNPVPNARLDDGLIDVLLVRDVSRLKVAGIIGKYKAGQFAQLPDYVSHFQARSVTVKCDTPNSINLDGELLVDDSVTFRIHEKAIRFFYPRGASYDVPTSAPSAPAKTAAQDVESEKIEAS